MAGGVVGQGIAREDRGNRGIDGTLSVSTELVGIGDEVLAGALSWRGHGEHLRGSEDLAESLILAEVEGRFAAIVEVGQKDGAAVGESEFVAAEGRDAARLGDGGVVEVIARIEGGVAQELEERAVKSAAAGAGDDVGESGCAAADLGGHPAGDSIGFPGPHRR